MNDSSLPTIEIEARTERGTRANNRFRAQGLIPAVMYHRGEQSIDGVVVYRDFAKIASQSTSSQVFILKSKDARFDGRSALVKEVQRDFLNDKVLHVDLMSLKDDEEISVRVPVVIKGEAFGVKTEGGILTVSCHDVGVSCLPRLIPRQIVIDVTDLKLGKSIHASDLALPEGVSLDDDAEETIVSVVAIRVVEEAAPTSVADEAVAAAAAATAGGAGASGAAPAAEKKK